MMFSKSRFMMCMFKTKVSPGHYLLALKFYFVSTSVTIPKGYRSQSSLIPSSKSPLGKGLVTLEQFLGSTGA